MTDQVPKFAPMEWAVLVNGVGGRLCQVETTTWTINGTERVHEHYIQPGDTLSRHAQYPGIGYHVDNLIKCRDKATAEAAAELLKEVYEAAQQRVRQAERDKEQSISRAVQALGDLT